MAIPLPNPNINDFDTNDVQTWSSNKMKEGFDIAGVVVNTDGSLQNKSYKLLKDITTTEDLTSINLDVSDLTAVFIVMNVKYAATTTSNISLLATSPDYSTPFNTSAYASRSFTADTDFSVILMAECTKGLIKGEGLVTNVNGNGSSTIKNYANYRSNILTSVFKTLQIDASAALPTGTTIKVYGY